MRVIKQIILREQELAKYQVIKKLVESDGNKERAAVNLNCSVRHVNRLAKGYSEFGKQFFVHGNRGRKPSTTLSHEVQEQILSLFRDKYYDFNFKHFFEKLQKDENINCSYPTVVSLLYSKGILSPKSHKKTKKKIKKAITTSENLNELILKNEIELAVDPKKAHPRMSRSKYFGELLQMDASHEYWFGETKSHLHIAIDDSTGKLLGAYFDTQETLYGYYQVTAQILKNYGIPAKFLTDKRTVFEYKKSGDTSIENDYSTQFGYACSQLGIALETSSVPQAKGRVERAFGTLQSRLIAELRLSNVTEITSANDFLVEYIQKFNEEFSINSNSIKSVFESKVESENINLYLSVLCDRIVDKGHSVKVKNQYYFFLDDTGKPYYLKPKTSVSIAKSLDGRYFGIVAGKTYNLLAIESHEKTSKDFDLEKTEVPKPKYKPPMNHPWKAESFARYLAKTAYQNSIA